MDVNIYGGELNCDDVRRKFAGKEIGILGEFVNLLGQALPFEGKPLFLTYNRIASSE